MKVLLIFWYKVLLIFWYKVLLILWCVAITTEIICLVDSNQKQWQKIHECQAAIGALHEEDVYINEVVGSSNSLKGN